jgi:hypothetical protein
MSGTRSFFAVPRCPRRSVPFWLAVLFLVDVSVLSHPLLHPQDIQSPVSSTSTSLRGTVINSVTREPVVRALVFSTDNRVAKLTDDQGRFEFQLSRIDSVQLMARKPGFLEGGSAGPYQPQSAAADMTIALTPESLIVGQVNLPSSNQFDRMTVQVYRRMVQDGRALWGPVSTATTRSNGEFRVANLTAGSYKIFTDEQLDRDPITFDPRGQLFGYPPIYYPGARDLDLASIITLEAGKTFQVELSPVLQTYYPVKIALPDIQPGSALNISVALEGHRGPGYSLGYRPGQSIEGMLPNGTYTVDVVAQQGQQTATGSANITVKDAPLTHASMVLLPNGSIPVNIKDELSDHQSNLFLRQGGFSREQKAEVSLQPADQFGAAQSVYLRPPRKLNDNDLVLDNVQPGRYWLKVYPSSGYVASAVAGSVDLLRQPLVVGPGGASVAIDIILRDDGAAIDGTVEGIPAVLPGAQGEASARPGPVTAAAYVYCIPLPDSPGRFATGFASAQGFFHFQQLAPGVYRVLAFDRQQSELEYQNAEAMSVYDGKGPVVRLVPGQTEQLRIPLVSTRE